MHGTRGSDPSTREVRSLLYAVMYPPSAVLSSPILPPAPVAHPLAPTRPTQPNDTLLLLARPCRGPLTGLTRCAPRPVDSVPTAMRAVVVLSQPPCLPRSSGCRRRRLLQALPHSKPNTAHAIALCSVSNAASQDAPAAPLLLCLLRGPHQCGPIRRRSRHTLCPSPRLPRARLAAAAATHVPATSPSPVICASTTAGTLLTRAQHTAYTWGARTHQQHSNGRRTPARLPHNMQHHGTMQPESPP